MFTNALQLVILIPATLAIVALVYGVMGIYRRDDEREKRKTERDAVILREILNAKRTPSHD